MEEKVTARELTVALINRVNIPGKPSDAQYASKWVAEAYKIIYKAVFNPLSDKD